MQLEGHVLQPLLLGRAVRVHPLAVVLSIAAGLLIAGIFGALIAVPIVACANVAGTYLSRRHEGPRPPEPEPERARVPRSPAELIRPSTAASAMSVRQCASARPHARHPLVGGLPGRGEVGPRADDREHPAAGRDHRAVGAAPRCRRAARPSAVARPVIGSPVRGGSG